MRQQMPPIIRRNATEQFCFPSGQIPAHNAKQTDKLPHQENVAVDNNTDVATKQSDVNVFSASAQT